MSRVLKLRKELVRPNPFGKSRTIQFRLAEHEYSVLKQKAALYTDGNVSHWIRAALKNYRPRKSELEISHD